MFRKFIDWEWYNDTNAKSLFLHCLLKANWEDSTWQGILIKKGSFLTGRQKLAKELNLTEMQIRTALKKLKSSNEITVKSTNEYSIITVNNWASYQDNQQNNQQNVQKITSEITSTPPSCNKHFEYIDNQQNNQQITSEITSHITTIKEYKNKRNNYNPLIKDNYDISYSDDFLQKSPSQDSVQKKTKVFVKPTIEEIKQFCTENNKNVDAESFYNFYESKNWMIGKNKMQKWKAAVCTWDRKNKVSKPSEPYKQTVPVYSNEIED